MRRKREEEEYKESLEVGEEGIEAEPPLDITHIYNDKNIPMKR